MLCLAAHDTPADLKPLHRVSGPSFRKQRQSVVSIAITAGCHENPEVSLVVQPYQHISDGFAIPESPDGDFLVDAAISARLGPQDDPLRILSPVQGWKFKSDVSAEGVFLRLAGAFGCLFSGIISIRFAAFASVSTELVAFWKPPNEADVRRIALNVIWPATEESLEPRLKGVLHADRN